MTKRERAIISTYTGILCCDFIDMCLYVEELIGRGVMTHELARSDFTDELKEKSKQDFLNLMESLVEE